MEKIKNLLWSILGILIIVLLILFTGKKGTKILNDLDKKQKDKEEEVKNDLEKMSYIDIVHKYGDLNSARRIIDQGRNRLSDRGRSLLSGLRSSGVRLQDIDGDRIGHIGDSDKDSG